MATERTSVEIKNAVKEHYGTAIKQQGLCCGTKSAPLDQDAAGRFVELAGYSPEQLENLPEGVTSFGCGNPVNFIDVKEGEIVLDIGSGAGLDLILAAKKVGPKGKVIGIDMTPEMIEICSRNLKIAGITNAEVRLGEMETMPLPDGTADWIISNCVINLSPEKEKVFSEAFRVLNQGGQMLVSDIVTLDLPDKYRDDLSAWVGCIAGAVEEEEYIRMVKGAGFVDVKIVDKMVYNPQSLSALAGAPCVCAVTDGAIDQRLVDKYAGHVASIKLSARKPA